MDAKQAAKEINKELTRLGVHDPRQKMGGLVAEVRTVVVIRGIEKTGSINIAENEAQMLTEFKRLKDDEKYGAILDVASGKLTPVVPVTPEAAAAKEETKAEPEAKQEKK